jgi:hypothetical protein
VHRETGRQETLQLQQRLRIFVNKLPVISRTTGTCNGIKQEDKRHNILEALKLASDAFAGVSSEYGLLGVETTVFFICEHNLRAPYVYNLQLLTCSEAVVYSVFQGA